MSMEKQVELRSLSERKAYPAKHRLLVSLIKEDPDNWSATPDGGGNMLRVTHIPTGFSIHIPDNVEGLPEKMLGLTNRQRAEKLPKFAAEIQKRRCVQD